MSTIAQTDSAADWQRIHEKEAALQAIAREIAGARAASDVALDHGIRSIAHIAGALIEYLDAQAESHPCVCRVCGCTDGQPCVDTDTGDTCSWAEPGLCSRCARPLPGPSAPSDTSDLSDRSEPEPEPTPRKAARRKPTGKRIMIPAASIIAAATATLRKANGRPLSMRQIVAAMVLDGFDRRGATESNLAGRLLNALKRAPNDLHNLGRQIGWVLSRTAMCCCCRRDFQYIGAGPIPGDAICGRPDCRPVDASHRGPARD